jgi:Holliday junction resolvase RusA-like endonuclease
VILSFSLPILAMGKERPRVTKFGTFMPKPYEVWRDRVRWLVRSQVPAACAAALPLVGFMRCRCWFSVPRGVIRCDLDNAAGALFDAIQVPQKGGWGLLADDRQIRALAAYVVAGPTQIRFEIEET